MIQPNSESFYNLFSTPEAGPNCKHINKSPKSTVDDSENEALTQFQLSNCFTALVHKHPIFAEPGVLGLLKQPWVLQSHHGTFSLAHLGSSMFFGSSISFRSCLNLSGFFVDKRPFLAWKFPGHIWGHRTNCVN